MKSNKMKQIKKIFLTILRNKTTTQAEFRKTADTLSHLLAHEASMYIETKEINIQTPLTNTTGIAFKQSIVLVPILRSGITMLSSFLYYFQDAKIGVVGLKRDEKTAQAHLYYNNMPIMEKNSQVIILDPMIATGGTGIETLKILRSKGIEEKNIIYTSIICAPEGIKKIMDEFPKIRILTAGIDTKLNKEKFIVPGLGDFGDRYFGTK